MHLKFANKSLPAVMRTSNNRPTAVEVHNDEVANALVMKVIGAYALEGVRWLNFPPAFAWVIESSLAFV